MLCERANGKLLSYFLTVLLMNRFAHDKYPAIDIYHTCDHDDDDDLLSSKTIKLM